MTFAIASGKGGTGKTTVATNLAKVLEQENIVLLDCDVEEPNCHLFLNPQINSKKKFYTFVPDVDETKCTYCGKCSELCQFNAIATIKKSIMIFPELCHSCEGCKRICPENAIKTGKKEIGTVSEGFAGEIRMINGHIRVGEAQSPPLIQEVKRIGIQEAQPSIVILDSPPGTTCPVIEAIKGSNFVILVTEPTPFGLHDLKLAVEVVRTLDIPFGVIINRSTIGDLQVSEYCKREDIDILLEIPDDIEIAKAYSDGKLLIDINPRYKESFELLSKRLLSRREVC